MAMIDNTYGFQKQPLARKYISGHSEGAQDSSWFEQPEPKNIESIYLFNKIRAVEEKCEHLEKQLEQKQKAYVGFIKINMIAGKMLRVPLDAIVEPDEPGFIARIIDLPLYGHGDNAYEAIDTLKTEVESLYEDLLEDDDFTDEWLAIKKFFQENIAD